MGVRRKKLGCITLQVTPGFNGVGDAATVEREWVAWVEGKKSETGGDE